MMGASVSRGAAMGADEADGSLSCAGRLQAFVFQLQLFAGFLSCRIERNTGHRADLLALRLIEMPDAFSAFVGVDLINQRPHEDGIVRAFGFTDITVDAIISDHQCHINPLRIPCDDVESGLTGRHFFLQPLLDRGEHEF